MVLVQQVVHVVPVVLLQQVVLVPSVVLVQSVVLVPSVVLLQPVVLIPAMIICGKTSGTSTRSGTCTISDTFITIGTDTASDHRW